MSLVCFSRLISRCRDLFGATQETEPITSKHPPPCTHPVPPFDCCVLFDVLTQCSARKHCPSRKREHSSTCHFPPSFLAPFTFVYLTSHSRSHRRTPLERSTTRGQGWRLVKSQATDHENSRRELSTATAIPLRWWQMIAFSKARPVTPPVNLRGRLPIERTTTCLKWPSCQRH